MLQWEGGKAAPWWEQKGPSGHGGVPRNAQDAVQSKMRRLCQRRLLLCRNSPNTAAHRMWVLIIQMAESLMGWIHW